MAPSSIYLFLLFLFIFTAIKYLLTLFPFHKATAIYTPIHAKAGEDAGMHLQVGLFDMSHYRPDLQVSLGQSPLHSTFEGFKVQFHLEPV